MEVTTRNKNNSQIHEFNALGTHWWISIYDNLTKEHQKEIISNLKKIIQEFENSYSRFIPTSYVCRLNKQKFLKDFPVELFEMLTQAVEYSNITKGYFNVAVGQFLDNIGYDQQYSLFEKQTIFDEYVNFEAIFKELDPRFISINENVSIDLGGMGKGWLIDTIVTYLKNEGIDYFFVNAGGDIYATSNFDKPIEFVLENPFNLEEGVGSIKIKDSAIASSSPSRRKWKAKNTKNEFHHLINVKTHKVIDNIQAVYTHAKTCLSADVCSTALFVSPVSNYLDIANYFEAEYMVIDNNGRFYATKDYAGKMYI